MPCPKPIADMVDAVAEATQTDPAMPATSALSALSACTGGHAEIEIRRGWREPLILYTATIAAPGERKIVRCRAHDPPDPRSGERSSSQTVPQTGWRPRTRKQVATKAVERQRNTAAAPGRGRARTRRWLT